MAWHVAFSHAAAVAVSGASLSVRSVASVGRTPPEKEARQADKEKAKEEAIRKKPESKTLGRSKRQGKGEKEEDKRRSGSHDRDRSRDWSSSRETT